MEVSSRQQKQPSTHPGLGLHADAISSLPPSQSHSPKMHLIVRKPRLHPSSNAVDPDKMLFKSSRPRRRYLIRRPRPLQYTYRSKLLVLGEEDAVGGHVPDTATASTVMEKTTSDTTDSSTVHHATEARELVDKQRERFDLFVDLIWVGIIGNISEVFSSKAFGGDDPSIGWGFLYFTLVFLPAWRIWHLTRDFLSNFYMDDLLQRIITFWILTLTVFLGNNLAYVTEDPVNAKTVAISFYLVIRTSFLVIEAVYSIFIPWLRWPCLISFCLYAPSAACWVVATKMTGGKCIALLYTGAALDYAVPFLLDSPWRKKVMRGNHSKAIDPRHMSNRTANFFVIVLGEGVLQLIKDGPLGIGLTQTAGYAVWALLVYYLSATLYFTGDGSQEFIPAVTRKGWRTMTWLFFHIPMFMAGLTLTAGIMFIIRDSAAKLDDVDGQAVPANELPNLLHNAMWTVGVSVSIIMMSITAITLLEQPVKSPHPLRIENRYIRLSGRLIYILIVLLLPLNNNIGPETYLCVVGSLLLLLSMTEWHMGYEKDSKILEPRPKDGQGLDISSDSHEARQEIMVGH